MMNELTPVDFKEANSYLNPPKEADGCYNIEPLAVYTDGEVCVSRWRLTLRQRLKVLFTGHIWLEILSGHTQPPVALDCSKTVFLTKKGG